MGEVEGGRGGEELRGERRRNIYPRYSHSINIILPVLPNIVQPGEIDAREDGLAHKLIWQ